MSDKTQKNQSNCCFTPVPRIAKCFSDAERPGIVLLVTLVILVVLSILGYTLSSRVAAQRHRDRYIIDYQAARYGCDSAVKYALATLQNITPKLVERPNEPDFSDLFWLSEEEYQQLLDEWAEQIAQQQAEKQKYSLRDMLGDFNDNSDVNNANDVNYLDYDEITSPDFNEPNSLSEPNEPNALVIRGPYGPPWPLVAEPIEFEIGPVKVRIEIEDENAKYPLGWALLGEKETPREAEAGLETFCEWMDVNDAQVDSLKLQIEEIRGIKPFKLKFEPIKVTRKEKVRTRQKSRRGRRTRTVRTRTVRKTVAPASAHTADFAKMFHSSLIDTEALARPTIISESRKESALKYMGMWASSKVNINTAPRQVLEAVFTFGGNAKEIAEEIIQQRRIKPFKDIDDLKKSLFAYSDSIEKCKDYITTVSSFFTIKVTAVSGVAEASAVLAIKKDSRKVERIAVISG